METVNSPEMGTPAWLAVVFKTPPVRANKGQSKHTQYHQKIVPAMNRMMGAQGRTEACALLALEYSQKLGLIRQFKEQPFKTLEAEFGSEIYPDFLAVRPSGQILVIEIKTERFLTHSKQQTLEHNRERFEAFRMEYLVWTDKKPLNHPVRHHLINMNRFAGEDIPQELIQRLESHVTKHKALNLTALFEAGFTLDVIYSAAWAGKVFFPIVEAFSANTKITPWRQDHLEELFFGSENSSTGWWKS
ncbi:hypothetical protein [Iodobacter fluviatilis]|uniref:TnsA endonuclease N terminal n=1 Tax=Iodobacter fluviatilis TaxID=537 RepID=A0A377SWS6_9NEIS|nr:hypothetical protein [Iodobacter fluviatilis]TCU81624.1 hypothetical protein EV682_12024 [Iodobacter fluviatilis]STR44776.1 Uncharacterised protein [Iodobacter fluviatilis]